MQDDETWRLGALYKNLARIRMSKSKVKGQGPRDKNTKKCWVILIWQCMVRRRVRWRPYAARSSSRLHCVAPRGWRGDGGACWWLACGFVGSCPRGRGYAGGKISACCLVDTCIYRECMKYVVCDYAWSEWVSSFLTAHHYIIGHSVP